MALPNPICLLSSLWRSVVYPGTLWRFGIHMSGHAFQETETHQNCTVHIETCRRCGRVEVVWEKGAN